MKVPTTLVVHRIAEFDAPESILMRFSSHQPWSLRTSTLRVGCRALAVWCALAGLPDVPALATLAEVPDFDQIVRTHKVALASVTSDQEALALFSSRVGPSLGLNGPAFGGGLSGNAPTSKPSERSVGDEPGVASVELIAALAAWRLTSALQEAAESEDPASLSAVVEQAAAQETWLLQRASRPDLRHALTLATVLKAGPTPEAPRSGHPRPDPQYEAYLDRAYPRLSGSETSWIAVAEREGLPGIRRRLMEYWEEPGRPGVAPHGTATAQKDREELAAEYFQTRLRPLLRAQLIARAIRQESRAEQSVRSAWYRLQSRREKLSERKGLVRLCGTWQWTVHNHQNHQEHKMIVTFPHPDTPPTPELRPAKIIVLADGVYLRWEFQGGYQEDSLLFTGEGQRLEGSFVNSAGAWGSITGKRMTRCMSE